MASQGSLVHTITWQDRPTPVEMRGSDVGGGSVRVAVQREKGRVRTLPTRWPWADTFTAMLLRLRALPRIA